MTATELIMFLALLGVTWMAKVGVKAAYQNGVTDGAGAVLEPGNPGYRLALEYLKETMSHRWPMFRRMKDDHADSGQNE